MNFKTKFIFIVFFLGILSCTEKDRKISEQGTSSKYIMDMVFNNLGLPPRVSEFNNPEYVKEMGFNGMTPHWYVQCGITYDSLEEDIIPENSDERKWIEANAVKLNKKIKDAKKAGVKINRC